jgi:hypothetical protein
MVRAGGSFQGAVARVKQLVRLWTAGDLVDVAERAALLRTKDAAALLDRVAELGGVVRATS